MPPRAPSPPLRCRAMDLADQWPLLLVALALLIIMTGVVRRVAKLAFVGVVIGAVGLVIWPMVSESL